MLNTDHITDIVLKTEETDKKNTEQCFQKIKTVLWLNVNPLFYFLPTVFILMIPVK